MTNTEEIELGEDYEVYNRVGRVIGWYTIYKTKGGFSYGGGTYDKKGQEDWDLNGYNPDYPTVEDAVEGAIDNVKWANKPAD